MTKRCFELNVFYGKSVKIKGKVRREKDTLKNKAGVRGVEEGTKWKTM